MRYMGGKSRIATPYAPGWDVWGNEVNKYET